MRSRIIAVLRKTTRDFAAMLPIVLAMLLFTSLALSFFGGAIATELFGHGALLDTLLGAVVGSVSAGHPSASYILGGELLAAGVGLGAVTALIVSWVTVGLVQLPAEILFLGQRFALLRNLIAFCVATIIGILVPVTMGLLGWASS